MALSNMNAEVERFMSSPLVAWFGSCLTGIAKQTPTYDELVDGVLIHQVCLRMNYYGQTNAGVSLPNGNHAQRLANLRTIMANIRPSHGEMQLQEPELRLIAVAARSHVREVELLLELMLGCAMKCPNKRFFIERITWFEHGAQEVIASHVAKALAGSQRVNEQRDLWIQGELEKYAEELEALERENARTFPEAKSEREQQGSPYEVSVETRMTVGYTCPNVARPIRC